MRRFKSGWRLQLVKSYFSGGMAFVFIFVNNRLCLRRFYFIIMLYQSAEKVDNFMRQLEAIIRCKMIRVEMYGFNAMFGLG